MFRFKLGFLFFLGLLFFAFNTEAKVRFIVDVGTPLGFERAEDLEFDPLNRCVKIGYPLTGECPAGEMKGRLCPDNNNYYDRCCSKNYAHTDNTTCTYPRILSNDLCNGKRRCICDRLRYPYDKCEGARIASADKCIETVIEGNSTAQYYYYADCHCPVDFISCKSPQVGVGDSCEGKYAACRCPAQYSKCTPAIGAHTCVDSDGTKYDNCKPECDLRAYPLENSSTCMYSFESKTCNGITKYRCVGPDGSAG